MYEMSWDWDAKDINLDEDDERMWVPITPKTLKDEAMQTAEVKQAISEDEEEPCTIKNGPHWTMSMYAVTHGPTGVMQALMPICQVMGMPIIGPRETAQSPSEWSGIPESSTGAGDPVAEQVEHILLKVKASQGRQLKYTIHIQWSHSG